MTFDNSICTIMRCHPTANSLLSYIVVARSSPHFDMAPSYDKFTALSIVWLVVVDTKYSVCGGYVHFGMLELAFMGKQNLLTCYEMPHRYRFFQPIATIIHSFKRPVYLISLKNECFVESAFNSQKE